MSMENLPPDFMGKLSDTFPIRMLYTNDDIQSMVPEGEEELSQRDLAKVARMFGKHADHLLSTIWDMIEDEVQEVLKERDLS